MEGHTFEVMYKGFATYCKRQGWPTPDRTAIEGWESWKAELVSRLSEVEKEENGRDNEAINIATKGARADRELGGG